MPWSVAFMVVMIVLIVTLGRVAKEKHRAGARALDDVPPAETIARKEEVRQLKERIAVLERLVTENHGSVDLGRRIDDLRDR